MFEKEDKNIFWVIMDLPGHQKLRDGELTGFIVWIHNHGVQYKMSIHCHNRSSSGGQKKGSHFQKEHISIEVAAEKTLKLSWLQRSQTCRAT